MGTSVSSAATARTRTIIAALAAFALTLGLAPMVALGSESVAGPLAGPGYEGDARSASADSDLPSAADGPTLASTLAGSTASIVSADVALDAPDPVVGSFTVDGLTYAIDPDGLSLVAISPDAVSDGAIAIPASVTYDGTAYDVVAVGPYAFYLSGATSVELPASIVSVDSRAFRSSDVGRVEVDPGNLNIASYEGALYSADESCLLLIPEGRAGSVPIPSEAEVVEPSVFSHCSLVDAISVDGDGAAFLSWDGLLYDASGTTLLRVPAGATEITMRDGCTAIAAGAMEGCAKLERITAPASVTSISPDVLTKPVVVVSPPAQSLIAAEDSGMANCHDSLSDNESDSLVAESGQDAGSNADSANDANANQQIAGVVALDMTCDSVPQVASSSVTVVLSDNAIRAPWMRLGFNIEGGYVEVEEDDDELTRPPVISVISEDVTLLEENAEMVEDGSSEPMLSADSELPAASVQSASTYSSGSITVKANGGSIVWVPYAESADSCTHAAHNSSTTGEKVFDFTSTNATVYPDKIHLGMGSTKCKVSIMPSSQKATFLGWSTKELGLPYVGNADGTYKYNSGTLYANWAVEVYWEPNGGYWTFDNSTSNKNESIKKGISRVGYGGSGTLPKRAGYTFAGWSTNPNATSGASTVTIPMPSGNNTYVDFYAIWQKKASHAVTLNKNGGSGGADTVYYWPDKGYTISSSSTSVVSSGSTLVSSLPARSGYRFDGYYSASSGGTQYVDSKGKLTSNAPALAASTTWYARWTQLYTVAFDKKGGSGGTSSTSVGSGESIGSISVPTLSGWTFSGYTDDMSTNTYLYVKSDGAGTTRTISSNKTLLANWTKTVSLNANGGTAGSLTSITAGIGRPLGQKCTQVSSSDSDYPIRSLFSKGITDDSGWKPTCSGYQFLGYFDTSATTGGTCYINADGSVASACDPVASTMPSTLYARWGYTVTFDKQGGLGGTDSTVAPTGASVPTVSTPSLSGWTFRGYTDDMGTSTYLYVKADGTGTTRTITGNKTLLANWTKTVRLSANGGTAGSLTSLTAGIGRKLGQKCGQVSSSDPDYPIRSLFSKGITDDPGWAPTRSGRAFLGFYSTSSDTGGTCYINADGSAASACNPVTSTMPSTLYARWGYTVTFDKQGGSGGTDSMGMQSGSSVPTITTPSLSGWTFRGYTDSLLNLPYLYVKADGTGTTRTITENDTLYANWTKTVSLSANGGTAGSLTSLTAGIGRKLGQKCSQVSSTDADYPIRSLFSKGITDDPGWAPTRAGFTFQGYYNTNAATGGTCYIDANGTAQSACDPVTSAMPSTLYARWSGNDLEFTWDPHNGEEASTTTQTYSTTAKVALPATPTWAGRTFAGWYTAETGGTQVTNATDLPTESRTYHAHWTEDAYAISYDYDGGSVSGNPTTYKVSSVTFTLKNPTRTGYAFTGWSGTGLEGEDNMEVKVEKGSTGDRTYTAHWEANPYAVEYYDHAGTTLLSRDDGFVYDEARALAPVPDASAVTLGYEAVGWASEPGQAGAAYGFASSQRNLATGAAGDEVKRLYLAESPKTVELAWMSLGEGFATTAATFSSGAKVPMPEDVPTNDPGWAFMGWWTAEEGGDEVTADTPLPTDDATFYAHWAPVVSADVPIEVTARVDLLGLEEQAEASGYIESRCGEALEVAEVSFEPLAGATQLFGSRAADVALEALVAGGEGQWWASQPVLRFPLDGKGGAVGNGDRLAAFDMASYGTRVGIGYRFDIPDDVLAAIDPARFSDVTTPIGQVVYTVGLAS